MLMQITREIAYAAGQDAGNRSMRKAGRTAWNEEDWNAACEEFARLWPEVRQPATWGVST